MPVLDDTGRERFQAFLDIVSRVRGGQVSPIYRPVGVGFAYADGEPGQRTFHDVDPESGSRRPLFDEDRLRKVLEAHLRSPLATGGVPFETFSFLDGGASVRFCSEGDWLDLDLKTYAHKPTSPLDVLLAERCEPRTVRSAFIAGDADTVEVSSPDGSWLLTEREDNLWLRTTADDRLLPLTHDGEAGHPWLVDGALWSPEGLRVLAGRSDRRHMKRIPVVHWLKTAEEVEWFPYAKTGDPLEHPAVFVIDVLSGRQVRVQTLSDDPEVSLIPIGWSPAGTDLFFLTLDRGGKNLRLLAADAMTGQARLVVEERQDTFILGSGYDSEDYTSTATLLPDGNRVVWISRRDGWRHLYLYGTDGTEIGRLTSGEFEVDSVIGFDERTDAVYLLAYSDLARPYDRHVCRAGLDGSGLTQLTNSRGVHSAEVVPGSGFLIDTHSALDRAPRVDLIAADGRHVLTLCEADTSGLDEIGFEPGEDFTALAGDATTVLHGVLYKPPGFHAGQNYPVIEWIYGGPQDTEHEVAFLDKGLVARALAQLGFVVYTVDGRGTPCRGKAFHDVAYGRFGQFHVDDHAHVLRQLIERFPFFDHTRVGVAGGSWGGYNTVRSLLLAPELYHVGVACVPVGDLWDHMAYVEPLMGSPRENRAAYDEASCLTIADRLEGKLLIIAGTSDVNATISATFKLIHAFVCAGKPIDVLPLPDQNHDIRTGPYAAYAMEALARYFVEHLAP